MNLCGDVLKDITSSGDGLLNISEEVLQRLIRKESIYDVYHVEQTPFARGKFATVRKARHLATGVEYAAKFIRKRRRGAMDTSREIAHEVAVLLRCAPHPRLVRLHEVYEARAETVLVLELAAGGELQRVLDTDECLREPEARRAMRQILEGLLHLHDRNIAHLDLKPQNLLLVTNTPPGHALRSDIKLCDFGISRVIEPGVEVREILGTPDYVAPEILSYEPISLTTDIWSVGVLAYVLLTGYSPFGGDTKQETYLNISQCALTFPPELFADVSNTAKDFVKSALVLDPRCRPSAKQLLEHPWLGGKCCPLLPGIDNIASTDSVAVKNASAVTASTPLLTRKGYTNGTSPSPAPPASPSPLAGPQGGPASAADTPKAPRKGYTTAAEQAYGCCLHSGSCAQCARPPLLDRRGILC